MQSLRSDTVVSIITCHPGSQIYELEGHTALRIRMPHADMAVNYGVFDFDAPNFVYRFVKGETDYMCAVYDFSRFLASYQAQGREVVEQTLDLTPRQKETLVNLIAENVRPENAVYRYNYVKDNCATRPLAIVEKAIGDTVTFSRQSSEALTFTTFRDAMRQYHSNYPWYQFGIDLALGSGIDYPATTREKTFAPVALERLLSDATVGGRPLVSSTTAILPQIENGGPQPATPWILSPLCVSLVVLALSVFISFRNISGHGLKVGHWFDSILFGINGLAGLLLTFLIFVSVHEATSPNWLYLWLNPLALLVPALCWLKSCKKIILRYHFVNFVLLSVLGVVWWFVPQSGNLAFLPLIVADYLRSASYIYIHYARKR